MKLSPDLHVYDLSVIIIFLDEMSKMSVLLHPVPRMLDKDNVM